MMVPELSFFGAAGTVTGSCYLLDCAGGRVLIDCGLFQGAKTVRELNYRPLPFDPKTISALILTHAHIDHSGLIPRLVKQGFTGPIYSTSPTADLASVMLPDSGHIQESEVERLNRRNAQRGRAAVEPIYTKADAEASLRLFRGVDYCDWAQIVPGLKARFWNAGHILGSASVELTLEDHGRAHMTRLLFSGDIGPDNKLLHPDPDGPSDIDVLVMESTYGGRTRPVMTPEERRLSLGEEVLKALKRGGPLLIPSFAVERTQELLADLMTLMRDGAVPRVPIFLDSPLAIRATEIFAKHAALLDHDGAGSSWKESGILRFSETQEDSKAIDRLKGGFIVMAASGMCEAGRIRHHLKRFLWRKDATVLLSGYQAGGTLGAALLAGESFVRIHGEEVAVHAAIRQTEAYSGHADGAELVEWALARRPVHRAIYLTHGEPDSLRALAHDLAAAGIEQGKIHIPSMDMTVPLTGRVTLPKPKAPRLSRPQEASGEDWRNEYARLALAIERRVAALPDAKERARAIAALRHTLDRLTT